jgi:hypothetical protein
MNEILINERAIDLNKLKDVKKRLDDDKRKGRVKWKNRIGERKKPKNKAKL